MTSAVSLPGVVSLLIPLYRHERTVGAALDSVLLSDTSRVELIVSDDASPDDSFEVARAWVEAHAHRFLRASVVRQPRNLGITGNLNALMTFATGEFVTLFASDDLLAARAIDVQREYLAAHPEADFVFANMGIVDEEGRIVRSRVVGHRRARLLQRPTCSMFDIVYRWGLPWPRLFARRSAFMALGPYIADHSFEDRWSALVILRTGRYGYLDDVVQFYRLRARGGATGGIDSAILLRDMHDVERRLARESTGLLRLLLWTRVRSFPTSAHRQLDRWIWVSLRRLIQGIHRTLCDYGERA